MHRCAHSPRALLFTYGIMAFFPCSASYYLQPLNRSTLPLLTISISEIIWQYHKYFNSSTRANSVDLAQTPKGAVWSWSTLLFVRCFSQSKSVDIFLIFLHEIICCGHSLEAPLWGASNEYPQHMFSWGDKRKISTWHTLLSRPMIYRALDNDLQSSR